MKILVACEESQAVCKAFREKGHEAYSCDIEDCSGGHPEWHVKCDALELLKMQWDMIIAFPPCTYLSSCGTRHFSPKCNPPEKITKREKLRKAAAEFFMAFVNADCPRIAIENPVGYMNTHYQKPTQIVEPYYFAKNKNDKENYVTKRTCLWLKGLPPLERTSNLDRPKPYRSYTKPDGNVKNVCWEMQVTARNQKERAKLRSKTFSGIAKAMAEQWGGDTQ